MYLFAYLLGFLDCMLLVYFNDYPNKSNLFLSFFFFCSSIFGLTWISYYVEAPSNFSVILISFFPFLNLSLAPAMYFYVRSFKNPTNGLSKLDLLHFLPALVAFLNFSTFHFLTMEEKFNYIIHSQVNPFISYNFKGIFYTHGYNMYVRVSQLLIYLFISVRIVIQLFNDADRNINYLKINFKWLFTFLSLILINTFLTTFIYNYYIRVIPEVSSIQDYLKIILIPLTVTSFLNISVLFFPRLVFAKLFENKSKTKKNIVAQDRINKIEGIEMNVFLTKINAFILTQQFLNSGFSLSDLSKYMEIPTHQITNQFNLYLDISFSDWKRSLRIAHAVKLIDSGEAIKLTLESISLQCGYKSRANFINDFKLLKGMTPSQYMISVT